MNLRRLFRSLVPGACAHERRRCIHGDEGWDRMSWRGVVRRQSCLDCGRALDLPAICTLANSHQHYVTPPGSDLS